MKEDFEEIQVLDFKKPKKTKPKAEASTFQAIQANLLLRSKKMAKLKLSITRRDTRSFSKEQ